MPLLNGGVSYVAAIPNSVQAGTVIPAVLLTGVNTDVGGQVIAQVSGDVYDSLTGQNLLIPAGSRLVGKVEAGVKDTQKRVNIAWDYLLLPNGGSYALGSSMIAADYGGDQRARRPSYEQFAALGIPFQRVCRSRFHRRGQYASLERNLFGGTARRSGRDGEYDECSRIAL